MMAQPPDRDSKELMVASVEIQRPDVRKRGIEPDIAKRLVCEEAGSWDGSRR